MLHNRARRLDYKIMR
ncbi:hypothetical protein [Escherichia coli]|nr:hypothetical protein [Escherichia coli]